MQNVFVYRNLTKRCYSVKDIKTGLVVAHESCMVLKNCQLKVSQAGRKRVLKDKRKNVHAGIKGEWVSGFELPVKGELIPISYNPYKNDTFVTKDTGLVILSARYVLLTDKGAYALL